MKDLIEKITPDVDYIKKNWANAFSWENTREQLPEILYGNIIDRKEIKIKWNDKMWIDSIITKLELWNISDKEKWYLNRILRVYNMPNLLEQEWNPVSMVSDNIYKSNFFKDFINFKSPEVVNENETFDLFNFWKEHVARRTSDSYFIQKDSENTSNSMLLRPHTSVMWKYFLDEAKWKERLEKEWEINVLSSWKVYRVDDIDPTHHECFHQIDWLKIVEKNKEEINQETLKEVLENVIHTLFWEDIEYRFNTDTFPYTQESLEVEVMFNWKWLEVLWAWIVHPSVMDELWLDSKKYNWWAFGFWIERLAMALKKIPDIRLFWSEDERVKKQWWNFDAYKEVSNFPPVYKDISFLVPKTKFIKDIKESKKSGDLELENEADLFDIAWISRDVAWDMIEEIKIVDIFENDKKFWESNKSISIKITFRSLERTLTNDEINKMYFKIREKIETELGYTLR